ncbi:hypothetical protein [Nannocystis sp.]|nr:hypothetical protein [Nannocystis sp.]
MIFEEFAPTTAQRLDGLKALRGRVLTLISAAGGVCALIRVALMV